MPEVVVNGWTSRLRRIGSSGGVRTGALGLGVSVALTENLWAHAGHRGYVLLLPTQMYITGGGIVVALTFALVLFGIRQRRSVSGEPLALEPSPIPDSLVGNYLGLAGLVLLLASGFWGSRDPMLNPLPMTLWIVWWIGFTVATAVLGNFWRYLSPWPALLDLLKLLPGFQDRLEAPAQQTVRFLPALVLFFGFAWVELIHPAPLDPEVLVELILIYTLLVVAGAGWWGERQWLQTGEPFSVFFRMVGWLSPFSWNRSPSVSGTRLPLRLQWPCGGLLKAPPLPPSGVAFVLLVLSTVSFDGLSRTFWWLALVGENPLEFPGRTSMMLPNTLGLLGTFLVFSGAYWGTQRLAMWLNPEAPEAHRGVILSMIPIAFGYHFAHYLPALLVDVQYAFKTYSDPFGMGWDLWGTAGWTVSAAYLTDHESVVLIWFFQVYSIVLAHVGAVIVAHLFQVQEVTSLSRKFWGQVPSTVLMIGYTVFGLWLLSTPVAT